MQPWSGKGMARERMGLSESADGALTIMSMRRIAFGPLIAVAVSLALLPASAPAEAGVPAEGGGARRFAPAAPRVVFTALEFAPFPPSTDYCAAYAYNEIQPGGTVEALAVGETEQLRITAVAQDADGDDVRLFVGFETRRIPGFSGPPLFNPDSTQVTLTFVPPWGIVQDEPCELQGDLVLTARERVAAPDSQRVAVPFFAVWEGPDAELSLQYLGETPGLQGLLRWLGRVRSVGPNPIPVFSDSVYLVDFWIQDPDGLRVTSRPPQEVLGRQIAFGYVFPEIQFSATKSGSYCGRIELISGRDLNRSNNAARDCVSVAPATVQVVPNVATPNGDGENDAVYFLLAGTNIQQPRVRIYDLSGREISSTETVVSGLRLMWDGTDQNGDPVPAGSYIYVVTDGGRLVVRGTCGVIR